MSELRAFELRRVATVESSLSDHLSAPKQGDEGAPDAWLVFEPGSQDAGPQLTSRRGLPRPA